MENCHGGRDATRFLIQKLCRSGRPKDFSVLCEALTDAEFDHLACLLKKTVPDDEAVRRAARKAEESMQPQNKIQNLFDSLNVTMQSIADIQQDLVRKTTEASQYRDMYEQQREINEKMKEKMQKAMNSNVTSYIEKNIQSGDCVDSSIPERRPSSIQRYFHDWMMLRLPVNSSSTTEQIARQLGADIVLYTIYHANPPALPNKYAKCMREMVDEILTRHKTVLEQCVDMLMIDEVIGLQALWNISDYLFRREDNQQPVNWGHIASLYAFGGYLAQQNSSTNPQLAYFIGDFLGYYISVRLGKEIDMQGGWVRLLCFCLS